MLEGACELKQAERRSRSEEEPGTEAETGTEQVNQLGQGQVMDSQN